MALDRLAVSQISRRMFSLGALPVAARLSLSRGFALGMAADRVVTVTDPPYAAKCDGVSDDTAAIQAAIDRNKGATIVIPGRTLCAGVFLEGAGYNGTRIICRGELVLKPRPSKGTGNFYGVWAGLIFKDCENIVLQYRGHGNRIAQPDEEHCHLVGLAGVRNFECPQFLAREVRGDGIYISQSEWTRQSAMSEDVHFGTVRVINSEDDGRNAMSIISGRRISVDRFVSEKVGGVVGGTRQPGGLDIEPNNAYQICEDITVNTANVTSAGGQCFGVLGKDSGTSEDWIVRRIKVGMLNSTNTAGAKADEGFAAAAFRRVDGVDVQGFATQASTRNGTGLIVDNAKNAKIRMRVGCALLGATIGLKGWVRNSDLNITVDSYGSNGIETGGLSNTGVAGSAKGGEGRGPVAVLATGHGRAVRQENVRYSVTVPRTNSAGRGYLNDPASPVQFSGCSVAYSDSWGYHGATQAILGFGPGVKITGGSPP